MGALMRAHDWSQTPLGNPDVWPQSLRTAVRLLLNTGHPMYIFWGEAGACLYNDAYRLSIGPERHPKSLGRPAREVWDEIWDIIGPQIEQVMAGRGATWHVNQLVPITRNGRREDVYWTYSYSPIDDETAPTGVGGVLVVCSETTQQVTAEQRLAHLFEQGPSFMAMLEGPEHRFVLANAAYLKVVGNRPLLGRTVAEALPDAVDQGYLRLLDEVFRTGKPVSMTGAKYAVYAVPKGPAVERYVDFIYQPITGGDGRVTGIFVEGSDVTERHLAERALQQSYADLEQRDVELTTALQELRDHEALYRSALAAGRMGAWETDLVAGTRTWSPEGMALFGLSLPDGKGHVGGDDDEFRNALHPDDRNLLRQFHETADKDDSFAAEYRIVRPDGAVLWLSGRGQVAARTPDGKAHRLVSIVADITERRRTEDHIQFLMREMTHRSKNLLSVVQSIARQTSRTTDSLEDFDTRFGLRLQGLAASHDVLVDEDWRGAPLTGLVRQQLQPFVNEAEGTRVKFSGPQVVVTAQAAQAIGLALHELATNSLKYGALSTGAGHVEVSWAFENGGSEPRQLTLRWVERGGPPVTMPTRKGFGHMVIDGMIARSLDGKVSLEFAPGGLNWSVTMPESNLVSEAG